ncbi:TetR/AcrR family transcriptional regulator [Streptomyces tsukubensis]|uniref:TetR/AcrR family transcriptional regulator n=1 Tax=Streptomyces tsukubensis TaxID=83656 RepID=UPI0036B8F9ED
MTSGRGRGLRRDAEANRERLVAAAREVFAERGLGAPLDDIARRAGVNIATLYRRFPDRDSLVEAVLADRLDDLAELAEQALRRTDPWDGFQWFVERACAMQAADRGVTEAFTACFPGSPGMEEPRTRALTALDTLIGRACEQGRLRPGVTSGDVMLFLMANAGVLRATRDAAPGAWKRLVALLVEACRADGERGGAPLPPAVTPEELHDAMVSARPLR